MIMMKINAFLLSIAIFSISTNSNAQSIFENQIIGTNPNTSNPYSDKQVFDINIEVSGIGRGSGLNGNNANDRYNARDWDTTPLLNGDDYFEFTLTPKSGFKINFTSMAYKAQVSNEGPRNFAFRSSLDAFSRDISTPVLLSFGQELSPPAIVLSDASFQDITSPITFRFYGYSSGSTNGTFSINQFIFNGGVSCTVNRPSLGTVVQPTCLTPTGSIILNDLPSSGMWDLYKNDVLVVSAGSGNTTTVTGLTPGNYVFSVKGLCRSLSSSSVTINQTTTQWNGDTWSNGVPTIDSDIIFNGNYSTAQDLNACSCKVNSGTVTIKSDHIMTVVNAVEVAAGTLSFEDRSSLVQINEGVSNSGIVTYKRKTTAIDKFDYTYWSSPVSGQTLYSLSPGTLGDKFYSFDFSLNRWEQEDTGNIMVAAKGYIVRGPQSFIPPLLSSFEASFVGKPNNGSISIPIGDAGSFNLIGNPYSSALNAISFLNANATILEGTIYFWTHNTNIGIGVSNPGSGVYAYSADDYAAFNSTGGVATYKAISSSNSDAVNTNVPSGKIASGQAFFAVSKSNRTDAIFNNSMRIGSGDSGANSQFFKNYINSDKATIFDRSRVWLNLSNTQGAFKQILIGYVSGASNGYEDAFDGQSFGANNYLEFYSINDGKNLVIQGRGLPFENTDEVLLGYIATLEGDYTIGINNMDGLISSQNIFLEDKLTTFIVDLKQGDYTFNTKAGKFDDRFVLQYRNKKASVDDQKSVDSKVFVWGENKQIKISSLYQKIKDVSVYDLLGKMIYKNSNVNNTQIMISDVSAIKQVLLVKIVMQSGSAVIETIIF